MIRFTRTATITGGQIAAATTFAGEVTSMVNAKHGETPLRWGMQIGGVAGTVHWTMDLPDLATLERVFGELLLDAEYVALVDASGETFVPGSVQDTIVTLF